jgi:hypothetical protein
MILRRWWRAYQRRLDVFWLWPSCKRAAPALHEAQQAFFMHTRVNPAWRDLDDIEAMAFCKRLT